MIFFQPFQYNHQRVSKRSDEDYRVGCSGTGSYICHLLQFFLHLCLGIICILRRKKPVMRRSLLLFK